MNPSEATRRFAATAPPELHRWILGGSPTELMEHVRTVRHNMTLADIARCYWIIPQYIRTQQGEPWFSAIYLAHRFRDVGDQPLKRQDWGFCRVICEGLIR